jgi:16S rRNA (adenine1518-N6/adenine1519-N6)-dimethyltransferase
LSQTLSQIKQLLTEQGLRPKHRLGQNFLHDGNYMQRIIAAAEVQPGQRVLEVGPGTGALTTRLLDAGTSVIAVEIDSDLEPILHKQFAQAIADSRLQLIIGDILESKHQLNPNVIQAIGDKPFKLIANLPYQIASPLLANLVSDHPAMTDAVVMIQKEVGERLTASPGGKDYGPLGVLMQAMCEVRVVGTLPPGCFWPPPKVASAIVHLKRRADPLTRDPEGLAELLQKVFSQRRKQLGTILGRDFDWPAGVSPDARPESLSVEQLIALAER